ncbi:Uncharacterised protein [Salmonella enterica subsp. enterica serovar Bovismorbificans]|uniref:Uncharacterized protein n=1 Tax=Salmonella enterica subsp. enterica serovar Bovismorbificans TaxID=58097 RepID=A0A655ETC4_SALET|nr:Uncharacterised protein [Salmonella enterica subsp. enterica serovar Bovismorbificans]CQE33959.1 Uncharacterised protein [Salmonella enterica subsp. enterica serovar Typhimurium str. DT104]CNT88852.1 Uncharacterised protein [Salmonella enterica subsp. enterica serovar Bovismorbificans]CNU00003.1 Uncharacterised protein [Salmonella enterica subsp. enterica serovar Bovismorbificans]CNU16063.1 Uncharacterised protein [Salmonella enterica subsp. enterica serovar Bovismorbificans]
MHHQTHQLHHPALQGIDSNKHTLAFWRIIFQQFKRGHAQECGENHHADNRRRICASQIRKRIFRYKRQHQLRHAEIGHFADIARLNGIQTRGFRAALNQTFRRQSEQIGDQHAHQRCDKGSKQQRADSQKTDFPQLRGVMQSCHGA